MHAPAPSCCQFVDLTTGYFFDYRVKKSDVVCRIYDLGKHLIKDQAISRQELEKLPLILPEGKEIDELIVWILRQGFVPSLQAPGGFVLPDQKNGLQKTTLPACFALHSSRGRLEESFFSVKTLNGHQTDISVLCEVSSSLFVSGDENGMLMLSDPGKDFERIAIYRGHPESVKAICPLSTTSFATSSIDQTVKIWETKNGRLELVKALDTETVCINTLLGLKGGLLVTGSMDGTIKFWDAPNFSPVRSLKANEGVKLLFAHSAGFIICASLVGTLTIWDPRQGYRCIRTIDSHQEPILALDERSDGALLGSLTDGRILTWDPRSGECLHTDDGFQHRFFPMRILSNGLAATGEKNHVRLWHTNPLPKRETELYCALIEKHPGYRDVADLAAPLFTDKARKAHLYLKAALYFLNRDDQLQAADCFRKAFQEFPEAPFAYYKPYLALQKNKKELSALCMALIDAYEKAGSVKDIIAAYRTILSVEKKGPYFDKLFSCYQKALKPQKALEISLHHINFLLGERKFEEAETAASKSIDLLGEDSRIREALATIADAKKKVPLDPIQLQEELAAAKKRSLELEEQLLALQQAPPALSLRSVETLPSLEEAANTLCEFLPGHFATGSVKGNLALWNVNDRSKPLGVFSAHKGAILSFCSTPEGLLISGSEDESIKVWDCQDGLTCLNTLSGHTGPVQDLLDLDGLGLASASSDKTIRIWDLNEENKCIRILEGHAEAVHCIRKLPTGMLVSGSADQTVRFWNPFEDYTCCHVYKGRNSPICSLHVIEGDNLAGDSLAIGYQDGTIDLIDTSTYTCIKTLQGHTGAVNSILSLSSRYLLSASGDHVMRIWDILADEPLIQTIGDHLAEVRSLSIISRILFSCSMDGMIKVWSDDAN